ncbi:NlpC/P60 family protein [Pseudothermotoga sp.]|uniref:NlpC/P60 family protein n=1 Tax=Pseudothermotoga sp. TaxID=2033661 RepID=UPI000E95D285|nr:NlpC/P60 family protein [Pseudothermotoga sp.]HBJ80319.1 hypothetical protein [Pseudothermotoga sp.]
MRKSVLFWLAILIAGLIFGNYLNPLQRKVINYAMTMVGGEYGWGSYDPENRVFDCWNFATWVYHTALDENERIDHMIIGRSDLLWVYFDKAEELLAGDLLFNGGGHTVGFHAGIYKGNYKTIEARGGKYGIGVFDIRGENRFAPYGQTGNRFCYFSLLVRLWLHENPSFPYVYVEEPPNYFFRDDGVDLTIHYYALPFLSGYTLQVEMLDYMTDEVIWKSSYDLDIYSLDENVLKVHIPTDDVQNIYVYFKVRISLGTCDAFSYDTKILKFTEIM